MVCGVVGETLFFWDQEAVVRQFVWDRHALFFRRVALHYHLLGSAIKERPLSVYFARHYVKYRASTDTDLSGLSAIFVENVSSEKQAKDIIQERAYRREEETSNVKVTYSKKRHRGLAKGKKEEEEASTIDDTSPSHIKRSHKRHLCITDDVTI